ncbi:hypothetical protein Scep_019377 [Stephania cephalantha]|uniref:ZF-HD dimerization-type domain-containing protein n=1 Tax=Stephania cephalantha TaxID=152367 RepID=A0AAP0IB34_9MAGN
MMKPVDLTIAPFPLQVSTASKAEGEDVDSEKTHRPPPSTAAPDCSFRYRECMKNHAAAIGGHANDGCGEFMPGREGQAMMKCAACGCHRNFHRKEALNGGADHPHFLLHHHPAGMVGVGWENSRRLPYLSALPMTPPPPPGLISAAPHHHYVYSAFGGVESREDRRSETPDGRDHDQIHQGGRDHEVVMMKSKRFRTKFTQEQKERMVDFAERIGWRMLRQNDGALNEFCTEIGVKRRVLKVWMHNNKNTFRKKTSSSEDNHAPPPPPVAEDDDDEDDDDDCSNDGDEGCEEEGGAPQSPVGG